MICLSVNGGRIVICSNMSVFIYIYFHKTGLFCFKCMKTHTHGIEKKRDKTTDTQSSPLVAHICDPDNAPTKKTGLPRKLDDARS